MHGDCQVLQDCKLGGPCQSAMDPNKAVRKQCRQAWSHSGHQTSSAQWQLLTSAISSNWSLRFLLLRET